MDGIQVPQTHVLTPLSLSDLCAQYLRDRFQSELCACSPQSSQSTTVAAVPELPPLMLLMHLASELDHIAMSLVDAYLNPG
jgi:hypothetical protein